MGYTDTLCRFHNDLTLKNTNRQEEFFHDIFKVIQEETTHYQLLFQKLRELDTPYGSMIVNKNILIDLGKTDQSLIDRICMVSMTHEGKGLDAGPRL